jgi:hypothetical protein
MGVLQSQPLPPLTSTPPAPPSDMERALSCQIESVPPGYVIIHTFHYGHQLCNTDVYPKDSKCDKDCIPDLLTDKTTSTCSTLSATW